MGGSDPSRRFRRPSVQPVGLGVRALRGAGRSPGYLYHLVFRHAAVYDPAEVSSALALASTYSCLPVIHTPSALGLTVTRLNPFALAGCGLVVALPTLTRQPRDCRAKARFPVGA